MITLAILKKQSLLALVYFLFIALLGVILRCFPLFDIDLNYRYLVHTHSHVALLGWIYTAFMVLIYSMFLTNAGVNKKYIRVFWFTQMTIVGMLVSFPITGYALFSILFSTLFLIASYLFAAMVFKHTPKVLKKTHAYKCIGMALWCLIISSIGPWALGIIMNSLGSASSWYRNAIYFYLHFQYNGWFILALFGILFFILEQQQIMIPKRIFKPFFILFNAGVILTFGISILWMKLHVSLNIVSGLGALFQIIAFYILLTVFLRQKQQIKTIDSKPFTVILKAMLVCFSAKLIMQFVGAFPNIADAVSYNVDLIIGYIHWVFLGVVSMTLLGFLNHFQLIKLTIFNVLFYIVAFIITEFIIFYKGLAIWLNLYLSQDNLFYLLVASTVLFLAIAAIFFNQLKSKSN